MKSDCQSFLAQRFSSEPLMNHTTKSMAFSTPRELAAMAFFEFVLGVTGVVTNCAVIVNILRKRYKLFDTPANFLVLNLAIVDAVVSLLAFPRMALAHDLLGHGESGLLIHDYFTQFALLASSGNLLLLIFNRFLSVYSSLKYPSYTIVGSEKLSVLAVVLVPWSAAVFFPTLFVVTDVHELTYISAVCYNAIILLTTAMSAYMFVKAYDQRKAMDKLYNSVMIGQNKSLMEKWRPLFRPVVVEVIFFTSCVSNVVIWYAYPTQVDRQSRSFLVHITWSYMLVLLNAVINPTVYKITHANLSGTSFPTSV